MRRISVNPPREADHKNVQNMVLDNLSGGYEKVEITSDDLSGCINRPMTIEEATAALELFINKKCNGKDRKKVRIVLK